MTAIPPGAFLERLKAAGVTRLTGVPCSSLTGLIDVSCSGQPVGYSNAPNEGEALGYAAGTWLGGGMGAVLCQNSGLGNLFNALTSLVEPSAIPVLAIVGWRGRPGETDEPQHRVMGAISEELVRLGGARLVRVVSEQDHDPAVAAVSEAIAARQALFLLAAPGVFGSEEAPSALPDSVIERLVVRRSAAPGTASRDSFIEMLARALGEDCAIVASTGHIGRAACALADRDGAFYLPGAMGHAAPVGLGVAEASGRPTVVLDGDGAILMRSSALAFVGARQARRFCHVVLDNGVHASTGGQPSLAAGADLAGAASAFGYRLCLDSGDSLQAVEMVERALSGEGPAFVRLRIDPQAPVPPRIRIPLPDLAQRMRRFCAG